MSYFPDLSPYTYFRASSPALNIGWLDPHEPFTTWEQIDPEFLAKLDVLPRVMLTRGHFACPFCTMSARRRYGHEEASSSCEVRARYLGITYAAPRLVRHYVRAHGYRPPDEFIEAVLYGQPFTEEGE